MTSGPYTLYSKVELKLAGSTDPKDVNYYLDDANRLHIPKLTVDAITKWL